MTAAAAIEHNGGMLAARLQQQIAERDEIIVALQHVIRELHHEVENCRAAEAYAALALSQATNPQAT